MASLKDAGHVSRPSVVVSDHKTQGATSENPNAPTAPEQVAPKTESEDNLLKVITLQSNPSHSGGLSGLSGMRQLSHTENVVALNTISTGGKAAIEDQEDKPENYLGDITVGAKH